MAELSDDTKLQVLHDHYKETGERISGYLQSRERLFLLIIALCTVMLFQVYSPENSTRVFADFIVKHVGLTEGIDLTFIGSVIWFVLLGTIIKYCQRMVLIERQYDYLHRLEAEISTSYFANVTYKREGEEYLKDYPKFSTWASFIYTILFPLILFAVVSSKIWSEIVRASIPALAVFNIVMFMAIIYSLVMYLPTIHRRRRCDESNSSESMVKPCKRNE